MRRSSVYALPLALGVLALPHCVTMTDGIEVDVAYQPAPTPAALQTGTGHRVRLERALIVFGEIELLRCDNFVRTLWKLFGPGTAMAHTPIAPTRLGVPFIIDLMESTGTPIFAGTLRPPPGRYCGVRAVGTPASQDSAGFSERTREMLDTTLLIQGRLEEGDGIDMGPIDLRVQERLVWELSFAEPLVLEEVKSVGVVVAFDQADWFGGIGFAPHDPAAVERELIENVGSSLEASL